MGRDWCPWDLRRGTENAIMRAAFKRKRVLVGTAFNVPCARVLSSDASPKVGRRGSQGFSLEKFTKVHHGSFQSRNGVAAFASHDPATSSEIRGAEVVVKALQAEGVKVHLGLSRRRGLSYLRCVLQARHHSARAGAPHEQAAVHAARRVRPCHRRSGCGIGHPRVLASPMHVTGIATVHGQHSRWSSSPGQVPTRHRPGCIPGMRHRRYHARWSNTTSWSRMRARP